MHFKKKSQTRNLPYFGNENFNETVESYHLNNRKPGGDVQVEFWISKLHQIPYHVAGKVTYPTIGKKTRISKKLPWKGLCSFQMRVQVSKMDESCVKTVVGFWSFLWISSGVIPNKHLTSTSRNTFCWVRIWEGFLVSKNIYIYMVYVHYILVVCIISEYLYIYLYSYIYILIHISGWIRWNNSPNCQVSESPPGSTCPGPSHSSDQRGCSTPVRCKVHGTQGVSLRMCQDVGVSSIRNGRKPLNINQKMSQLVKRINQKSGETIWQKTNSKTPSSIQSFDEKNLPEPEVAIYLLGEESLCWHIQIV